MTTEKIRREDWRNRYSVEGDIGVLTITRTDGSEHRVIFDAADLDTVKRRRWRISASVNKATGSRWTHVVAHPSLGLGRYLLGDVPEGMHAGHVNLEALDCRRANLVIENRSALKARDRQVYQTNTGHHHIHYYADEDGYSVTLVRDGKPRFRWFKRLDDAIAHRDTILAALAREAA